MKFKEGDVIVRIGGGTHVKMKIGDMDVVKTCLGITTILTTFIGQSGRAMHSTKNLRLSTTKEIEYYNRGIVNIADIPEQELINYEIY